MTRHASGRLDHVDGWAVVAHRLGLAAPGHRHLCDRVQVDDVLLSSRRQLPGHLTLRDQRRLVHVEHVEPHLDYAEGEPKDVWELQIDHNFCFVDQYQ